MLPDEEEVDLDWGEDEDVLDPAYEGRAFITRTAELPPGSGRVDWSQVQEALRRHRLAKGVNPDGSKAEKRRAETDEEPLTVIQPMRFIEAAELPQAPRGLAKRAVGIGWRVIATHSRVHTAAVLYQEDSKGGENAKGEQHNRGDVRFPAQDRDEYVVQLIMPGQKIGLRGWYETQPRGDKVATAFKAGWTRDPLDGILFRQVATEMADWFDIFAPPAEPRKKRVSKEERVAEKLAAPIQEGEWTE